jgi:4-amino-4-deoxy-L-arabinose transferase-like glycosyltransferase
LKTQLRIHLFLFLFLTLKLILAAFFPVFGDEAYYYIWSLHPQLSYFDHPPMVSWIISWTHKFLPAGHPLTLRFGFVFLSYLTSLVWLKILNEKNFSLSAKFWFFILIFLNPLLGIGSIVATPDVPLVFFWSLSYLYFLKIINNKSISDYAFLGIFLGLGFCSKYHIVIFVLSGLIYLALSKKYRLLRAQGVVLTVLFGAFFSLPVIIWNMQNEWSSFLFQINHGFGDFGFSWTWPIGYVLAQFIIINPLYAIELFKKLPEIFNSKSELEVDRVFSLSQLGFFLSSSFKSVVEGNWPLTSHLHSLAFTAGGATKKTIYRGIGFSVFFYVLISLFFIHPASEKVRKNLINSSQLEDLYPLVEKYQPLYGPSYQVSSLISWKTQKIVPKLRDLSRHDFYDSLPESLPTESKFYALKNDYSQWPDQFKTFKKTKIRTFDKTGIELYELTHE